MVVVTQCVRGSVRPGAYATGSRCWSAGAVPGYDMTPEAALTKLAVLLADPDGRQRVEDDPADAAGELTR